MLVLLAAGISDRRRRGLATHLRRRGADDAFRYLQRIDFFEAYFASEAGGASP